MNIHNTTIDQAKKQEELEAKKAKAREYSRNHYLKNKEKYFEKSRKWRQENAEYNREYSRKRYEENKEEHAKRQKEYDKQRYQRNKDAYRAKNKKYYIENKKKCNEYNKKWFQDNKELCNLKQKEYRKKNIKHVRARSNKYFIAYAKKRRQEDELYFVKDKLRICLRNVFRRIKQNKPADTQTLLGCDWKEAKAHIESLFQEGMTWQNYGKWHLDHIRPVNTFAIEEVYQMNHISNLRPLWAEDNLARPRDGSDINPIQL